MELIHFQIVLMQEDNLKNYLKNPCFHYNIAFNIAKGIGPKTSFIFSYWFSHENIPALTDVYPPGFHYFSAFFLLFNDHYLTGRFANFFISIFYYFTES